MIRNLVLARIALMLLIVTGISFSSSQNVEEKEYFNTFLNERGDIELKYPKGWFLYEMKYSNPYQVIISPHELDSKSFKFDMGIKLMKIYNRDWYPETDIYQVGEYYESVIKATKDNKDLRILNIADINIGKHPALITEILINQNDELRQLLNLFIVNEDSTTQLVINFPEEDFFYFRNDARRIILNSTFSAENPILTDSKILIKEVEEMVNQELIRQNTEGLDYDAFTEVFAQAEIMSPNNAILMSLLGGYLYQFAQNSNEEVKKKFTQNIIDVLTDANRLFAAFPFSYLKKKRDFYRAQNNLIIGETYTNFLNQKEKAQPYYDAALNSFDNPMTENKPQDTKEDGPKTE